MEFDFLNQVRQVKCIELYLNLTYWSISAVWVQHQARINKIKNVSRPPELLIWSVYGPNPKLNIKWVGNVNQTRDYISGTQVAFAGWALELPPLITYLLYCICRTPAFLSWSAWPDMAMAPNAVPLRSKWVASERHPGHSSVITTVTGLPEHAALLVHFTW